MFAEGWGSGSFKTYCQGYYKACYKGLRFMVSALLRVIIKVTTRVAWLHGLRVSLVGLLERLL